MADEIKKDEVVVEEKKPADAVVAPAADVKKDEVVVDTRDYKAELAEKEKELGQAQHKIVTLKKSKKDEGKENKEGGEGEEEAGKEGVLSEVDQKLENFKLEQSQEILNDELSRLTNNPDKLALIKLTYDKKIVKGGFTRASIQADLASALAIVDRPFQEKTISELKKSGISDLTKNKTGAVAGQDISSSSGGMVDEQLTPMDRKIMARHSLTLADINKKK